MSPLGHGHFAPAGTARYYFGAGDHHGVPEDVQASAQGSEMGYSASRFGLPIGLECFSILTKKNL